MCIRDRWHPVNICVTVSVRAALEPYLDQILDKHPERKGWPFLPPTVRGLLHLPNHSPNFLEWLGMGAFNFVLKSGGQSIECKKKFFVVTQVCGARLLESEIAPVVNALKSGIQFAYVRDSSETVLRLNFWFI